jgi:[acyl-carrier-protein] S-malonyltransferase
MTGTAKAFGFKRAIDLAVGGAFHTPLMTDARDALLPTLEALSFAHGNAPVVSNVDAQPYTGESGWREQLADHLVRPVQWRRTMERLVALGATTFVEVGPGAVLTGLARRTVPQVHVLNVSVPDDLSSLGEVAQMEVA